jgi:hypothetical protein
MKRPDYRILTVCLGLVLFLLPACAPAPAPDRTVFSAPDEAANALMNGLKDNNVPALKAIFGPTVETDLSSGDPVADRNDRQAMALAMGQSWRWEDSGKGRKDLIIGAEKWPLPVPLTKVRGGWQFDAAAGKDEMLSRRIGRNELRAIDVCRRYVDMQKEYASQPRDGKVGGLYAQTLRSAPLRQDGLYWAVGEEEMPSPLGVLLEQAAVEGYTVSGDAPQQFWGYYFKVLTAQGPAAQGGAIDYVVNGEMSGGFALLAYPAEYGRGGIMSFLVNQDGMVHEADLGEDTLAAAAKITAYNPDSAWAPVKEPKS